MKSLTYSASSSSLSQPTKPNTSLVSGLLKRSEIDSLRQENKSIADYSEKVFAGRMSAKTRAKRNDKKYLHCPFTKYFRLDEFVARC